MKSLLPAILITLTSLQAEELTPASIQRFVAIDNVCAWPNLTLLPDGSINATIFGQPSHGQMAGAAECWNSPDGEFWTKRGIPAPNDDHTNRMNVAGGLAKNGDLLVLCSGWTDVKQPQRPKQAAFRDDILSAWICRSSDGGKTWSQIKEFPAPDKGRTNYIPFGDIKTGDQLGVLARFSGDEGKTWGEPIRIAHTTTWDCGYPRTVQRADGKLVTAWYAGASQYHARYHMGAAIWEAPQP